MVKKMIPNQTSNYIDNFYILVNGMKEVHEKEYLDHMTVVHPLVYFVFGTKYNVEYF